MARTQTETVGFARNTREALQLVKAELRKTGHHPEEIDAILDQQIEKTVEANARQEELKRALKAATANTAAETLALDRMASGYLDVGISAVGKGSDAAKNLQRLRSRIRMPAPAARETAGPARGAEA